MTSCVTRLADIAPPAAVALPVLVLVAAWLVGLVVVLRGTSPADRPKILNAYARAFPLSRRHARHRAGRRRRRLVSVRTDPAGDGGDPGRCM